MAKSEKYDNNTNKENISDLKNFTNKSSHFSFDDLSPKTLKTIKSFFSPKSESVVLNQINPNLNVTYTKEKKLNTSLEKSAQNPGQKPNGNKCHCTKSKCLKLYCECFANGRYCNDCACCDCLNTIENEVARKKAYHQIIQKNPKAIQKIKATKKSWVCKCKYSSCQKNYCDCYQNGKYCSSKCKCVDCKNKNKLKRNKRDNNHRNHHHKKNNNKVLKPIKETNEDYKYETMYTPKRKNYRNFKSESRMSEGLQMLSTAALSEISKQEGKSRRKSPLVFKKLNMNIDGGNGLFQ